MNIVRSPAPEIGSTLRRFFRLRYAVPVAGLLVCASALAQKSEKAESQESLIRRYPFDPACPSGRISNGKGMIVRCISEEEAEQLLRRTPIAKAGASDAAGSGGAGSAAPAASAGSAGGPTSADTARGGENEQLEVTVGPIVADQGELSLSKLAQPKARYARCVSDHGGLKDRSGEVHVRFLVRAQGIAEGVSIQKRVNVSPETARCVAHIVDRRRVGTPDAPLVGATVVVKFDRVAK